MIRNLLSRNLLSPWALALRALRALRAKGVPFALAQEQY